MTDGQPLYSGGQSVPDEILPDFIWVAPGETVDVYGVWNRLEEESTGNFNTELQTLADGQPVKGVQAFSADAAKVSLSGIIPVRIQVDAYGAFAGLSQLRLIAGSAQPSRSAIIWTGATKPAKRTPPADNGSTLGQSSNAIYTKPKVTVATQSVVDTLKAKVDPILQAVKVGNDVVYEVKLKPSTPGAAIVPSRFRFAYYIVQSDDSGVNGPISPMLGQTVWLQAGSTPYKIVLPTYSNIGLNLGKSVKVRAYLVAPDDTVTFADDVKLVK